MLNPNVVNHMSTHTSIVSGVTKCLKINGIININNHKNSYETPIPTSHKDEV